MTSNESIRVSMHVQSDMATAACDHVKRSHENLLGSCPARRPPDSPGTSCTAEARATSNKRHPFNRGRSSEAPSVSSSVSPRAKGIGCRWSDLLLWLA